ncbi:VWA domain-containing protein [Streptomyces sp. CAU 1734]|uniref:VWA domain-containing protein n=1 Tax=Streptomyces sp. CAU 1734 TaxID=3140360 RepID=UPI0032603450
MSGRRSPRRLLSYWLALVLLAAVGAACTGDRSEALTLRVLATPELADMRPLLDRLREETGIRLELDYRGTVEAADDLALGRYRHDLAWLSSDRPFRLKLRAAGRNAERPLSTATMLSPVAIGLRPATAARLRASAPGGEISWADVADAAAEGTLAFGMADPRHTDSGLAALVGVATAAAGTGGALRPGDVSCDRLRGFFSGHRLTDRSPARLADGFIHHQGGLDALITHESELLTLNRSGRLRERLEIVHPKDGMMLSDYPLLLLDPAKREAYDRLVEWLRSAPVQKQIMERTLRRPVDPGLPRIAEVRRPVGNALYFPDRQTVIDRLLSDYGRPGRDLPARVVLLLDFSGSMRGERIRELRATLAGLSGADDSRSGKFARFHRGETLTVIRFGGRVLDERSVTYREPRDLLRLRELVAGDDFDGATAIWSGLDHAYGRLAELTGDQPGRPLSIVLMTDGRNNAGIGPDTFIRRYRERAPQVRAVRTYAIRYGDADTAELGRAARATGGRVVDATARPLLTAFKEIRGCVD